MENTAFAALCSDEQALLFWSLAEQVGQEVMDEAIARFPEGTPARIVFSTVINEKRARWHQEQATRRPTDGQVESVKARLQVIGEDPAWLPLRTAAWEVLMDPKASQADFSDIIDTFERCGITRPEVNGEQVDGNIAVVQAEILAAADAAQPNAW